MLKNWFNTLKLSLTKPSEYRKLSERSFWSGYWYLFWLIFLGFLIQTIMFSSAVLVAAPVVKSQLPLVKTQMKNAFPKELVVNIKNGEASTNVTEPYVISLEQVIPQFTEDEKTMLLVIDTDASVENYPMHKTIFFLTKNSLVYPARNNSGANSYEVFPLSEIDESITMDKPLYDKAMTHVLPVVDKVPQFMQGLAVFALLLFPFIGGFVFLNVSLIYLLVMALLFLLVSKIMRRDFSFQTMFKATMYGLTMQLVLTFVGDLLQFQIPSLYNLAFIGWMICVLTLNPAPVYTKKNVRSKKISSR